MVVFIWLLTGYLQMTYLLIYRYPNVKNNLCLSQIQSSGLPRRSFNPEPRLCKLSSDVTIIPLCSLVLFSLVVPVLECITYQRHLLILDRASKNLMARLDKTEEHPVYTDSLYICPFLF